MAAVSALPSNQVITSRTDEDGSDPWDLSAPARREPDHPYSYSSETNQSSYQHHLIDSSSRITSAPHVKPAEPTRLDEIEQNSVNGTGRPRSPRSGQVIDPSYLSPFKPGLRSDVRDSRSGSDADSLLDLYGHPRSVAGRSMGEGSDRGERSDQQANDYTYYEDDDPEKSRWIHRDKLALIESQEMQEAGIRLPPPQPRDSSRSKSRRDPSQDRFPHGADACETEGSSEVQPIKAGKKRRVQSPARHEETVEETLVNQYDLRTPEEIAADSYLETSTSPGYRQYGIRSSSSRIPLPRSSPMPIPQEHIERNTPLPRKRGASGNWTGGDEDGLSYNRVRSRGNSVGSQVLLDDDNNHNTPNSRPPSGGSPTKGRTASTNKTHTGRKSSISTPPNSQPKPRSTSIANRSPSTPIRPKSRSGLETRPPTAINRPEGDPPWLATMYKPDPRLPPDQQLLPTHAKRLQQEQWDRAHKDSGERPVTQQRQRQRDDETKPAEIKRDFSPLAVHTRNGLQPPDSRERDEERERLRDDSEWPFTRSGAKSATSGISPTSENGKNAGYSTIPRVRPMDGNSVNIVGGVAGSPTKRDGNPVDPFDQERLSRLGEKGSAKEKDAEAKTEKGGCGCCVIM